MITKIDERKNIIVSLKSNYGERKKGIDKHIQNLKILSFMHILLSILCFGSLLTSIISEQFGYEFFKWQKTGMFALLSLIALLNLPYEIFELQLLNHLKRINEYNDFNGIEKLNADLKNLIDKLNNRIKTNMIPIILGILILIMSAWQIMNEDNPYWEYMKIPIILFFGFIIIRFVIVNKKLTDNIQKMENTVANTL
jgi:hypothetical protein